MSAPADADTWLLRLLGVEQPADDNISPEAIKARIFDVLRALLLHAATRRPVVIVVEDVHWIDRTSEEFLTTLVDRIVGARMLVILTFRPGYQMPWRDRSYVTQITLMALTEADSEALIDSVSRETPIPRPVAAVILGIDHEARLVQRTGDMLVAPRVLAHPVRQLDRGARLARGIPAVGGDRRAVR